MREFFSCGLALSLAFVAAPATAQVVVFVAAQNNTNVALRAGNSSARGGWANFERELQGPGNTLLFSTRPRLFQGADGSVELVTERGERAATVRFDFPYVGNDTAVLELAPGFYGYIEYRDEGMSRHRLSVDIRRQLQPPVLTRLPRTGNGVVRGRISWDPASLQVARSQPRNSGRPSATLALRIPSMAEAVKQTFVLQGKSPSVFAELDPSENRPDSYQGRPGYFTEWLSAGQVRWGKSDETGIAFELYDLPTDVPLSVSLRQREPAEQRFAPGPAEQAPLPATLVPPARNGPKFQVRVEYANRFRGPLSESMPHYDNLNITLHPAWMSDDNGDGTVTSLDSVSARLQREFLTRVNPNPLKATTLPGGSVKIKKGKLK